MPINTDQQKLIALHIDKLRGVKNLEISFEGSPVTGIFGVNGCGKTTILQTIVCLFRAKNTDENTRMSRFFKYTSTTPTSKWIGSNYSADVEYYLYSSKKIIKRTISYGKSSSRWSPKQSEKPDRCVIYIPLSSCIPDIERVSENVVTFSPSSGEELDEAITRAASTIMNIRYTELKVSKINKLDCYIVKRNDLECHSFNLSAGEQKMFRFLQTLYRAPKYSLIVIDELDLTLHTAALKRLIDVMVTVANDENHKLQIVFTSHRHELMKKANFNVRYIINSPIKTFCLDNPTDDCYSQLSGETERYLKVFVEDDLGEAIVKKCLKECGMFKYCNVYKFGSITNSVRLALGLACQYEDLSNLDDTVFFTDGDNENFTEDKEIEKQMNKTLSGYEPRHKEKKDKVLSILKHFNAKGPDGSLLSPEEFIHNALNSFDESITDQYELIRESKKIIAVMDRHEYVSNLVDIGYGLDEIVSVVATSKLWKDYVRDVKTWIEERKKAHEAGAYGI